MKSFLTILTCLLSVQSFADSSAPLTVEELKQGKPFILGQNLHLKDPKDGSGTMTTRFIVREDGLEPDLKFKTISQLPGKKLKERDSGCVLIKEEESASGRLEVRTINNGGRSFSIRLVEHKKLEPTLRHSLPLMKISADRYEDVFQIQTNDDLEPASFQLVCRDVCITSTVALPAKTQKPGKCENYLPTLTSETLSLLQNPQAMKEFTSGLVLENNLIDVPASLLVDRKQHRIAPLQPISNEPSQPVTRSGSRIGTF